MISPGHPPPKKNIWLHLGLLQCFGDRVVKQGLNCHKSITSSAA